MADEEPCAPGVCESSDLILSFVNTRPLTDKHPDLLGDQARLTEWLTTARLAGPTVVATNADAVAARELRDAFVTMLQSHVGCEDGPVAEAEAYLWRTAERYPLTPRIDADGCTLVPSQSGVPGAFGSLFAAVADIAARGAWSRLKTCKNPTCYSGFFDKTRNSSGLYCGSVCGSRMSMRAYRSRLKES
jgi:predicted RNA-binding Zn ribbon-like protein